ncbi:sulfite exporter TauE/SafE family protein [Cohnella sp. GbtcB17]|uniref:sulfite exporter TauE/SafE family protein n=1 Tax=Cohnella sp. GbtcB17 TaxID=2824762 RepID=UPI001C302946|nr:sulfite exporter TauE/SafE family protein [Cohnella sp. GbtcB17]
MLVQLVGTMFAVGLLLGFVGAGGSGFIISILTVVFGFSIHTSLGTALAAMFFSSAAGAFSHYREGNIVLGTGAVVGGAGMFGAWLSSFASNGIPGEELKWMTAGMLFLSGVALWFRMRLVSKRNDSQPAKARQRPAIYWASACGVGLVTGGLSGLFGIGATPFIQIGLMTILGTSIRQAAGTSMIVIIPIAVGGGAGFYQLGHLDVTLLLEVAVGIMLGSYIGAKFTRRVPAIILQRSMVLLPMVGAAILVL